MPSHTIVSKEQWLEARKAHLAREKEFTRLRDQLSAERRAMPWVKVDKTYVFEGPKGKVTLGELFDGRSQLIVYHFMFGPGWEQGCPSCSFLSDHIDGAVVHLAHRDVMLVAVSRAPLRQIDAFKKRMGWRFTWVSSSGTDFNVDFHVSFTKEQMAKGAVDYNFARREFPSEEAPGRRVLDLGCGVGQLAHHLAERGAAEVIGVDISERMLALARAERSHPRLRYLRMAIEQAAFGPRRFDLVVSSLAIHYVADYCGLVQRIACWLSPGGIFVYSTEHPVYLTRACSEGWIRDAAGKPLDWPVNAYAQEG